MAEHQRRRIDAAITATTLDRAARTARRACRYADPLPPQGRRQRRRSRARLAHRRRCRGGAGRWSAGRCRRSPTDPDRTGRSRRSRQPRWPAGGHHPGPAAPIDDVPPVVLNLPPRTLDTVARHDPAIARGDPQTLRQHHGLRAGAAARPGVLWRYRIPADDGAQADLHLPRRLGQPVRLCPVRLDDLGGPQRAFDCRCHRGCPGRSAPATLQIAPADVEDTYLDIDHIEEPARPRRAGDR